LNLPRAVVEAERKAEEALQRIAQARQAQQSSPDPAPPASSEPAPATPPAPSEPVAQATPAPTNTPSEPASPQGDDKWEARYKTLHGKYNAEVPRLHAALKEREGKLESLTEEVEALRSSLAKPKESLVKPEEVNEFGEPLVDLIRRAAREEVSGKDDEITKLKKRIESFEAQTVQTKEVGFFEKLVQMVPDWMAVNDDPDFHAWLGEVDEFTGYQRQDILSQAEEKRDADRVARFFNAFKKVQQDTAAASSQSLESQVAPMTTRTPEAPKGRKIWTRGEVADFYARARGGEYSDEQEAAIENEIQLAIRERRIR